jgi:sulfatase maturation enzyme AslB (radical SAM superfamily)
MKPHFVREAAQTSSPHAFLTFSPEKTPGSLFMESHSPNSAAPHAVAAAPDGHGGARLVDGFDRVHPDLRLSVTDRCNARCSYCMPAEGLDRLSRDTLLTDGEIHRLARIAVARLGIRPIRITGGEPLVRGRPSGIGRPPFRHFPLGRTSIRNP